jgi:hypothetical protein
MVSSRLVFFLSAIFIFTAQAVAQTTFLAYFCLNDKGNYTAKSSYEANLNHLLSSLSSNTETDYGFYNSSYGQNSDQAYAIGLCRGDVNPDVCRSCIDNATSISSQAALSQSEGGNWMVRLMYVTLLKSLHFWHRGN